MSARWGTLIRVMPDRTDRTDRADPRPRVALAACSHEPDLDAEGVLLIDALARAGVSAAPAVWDDASVAWERFDLVVVRATWDYPRRLAEFLAWAEHVDVVAGGLLNPLPLLRWSVDKAYLAALADAGVPTVPSHVLAPGEDVDHPFLDVEHVVKPTVSAGSRDTLRLGAHEADRSREHVRGVHDSGRSALAQPYLDAVDERGETALVFLDGAFSHAARKGALLAPGAGPVEGLYAEEDLASREASAAEREVGEACLAALSGAPGVTGADLPPLYARVDLLPGPDGPLVLEVELCEPSLFLQHADGADDRFAAAIAARLR